MADLSIILSGLKQNSSNCSYILSSFFITSRSSEHKSKIEQQLKCMVKSRLCMLFCIRCIVRAQLTWFLAKTVITYKYAIIILECITNSLNTFVKMHPKSMFNQQLLLIISDDVIKCFKIIMHNKTQKIIIK